MPNVVRFVLDTARDLHVPGAGQFSDGVLDVDANNLAAVTRARYLVQPYRAVELGIVDSATPPPALPAAPGSVTPTPDPYPQYLDPSELSLAMGAKVSRAFTKRTISASYTMVPGDAIDVVLHSTASSALSVTLPQDSDASIAQEVVIPWRASGAGQITFVAGAGATLISRGSLFKSAGQNAEGVVTKVAPNTWLLSGDLA